jgi:uncharacterized cupin superfamily protein
MPKIDVGKIKVETGSRYPDQYADEFAERGAIRLGDAAGPTQFGANITILPPGCRSSIRHWHKNEDEFVMVIKGDLTLVDDHGETPLKRGDFAAFPAGEQNGHTIANNSDQEAHFLVIGTHADHEIAYYSDIDMKVEFKDGIADFTRKDGSAI